MYESEELSRVMFLLPESVRADASNFIALLEDYYEFLNQSNQPSGVLNRLLSETDLYRTSEDYLNGIQAAIASYVPNGATMDRATLYKRIVRYFYNTRGSRESAEVFFRIFYDTFCQIVDPATDAMISEIGDLDADSQNIVHWRPYTYIIKTDVPLEDWKSSYRALVHPLGFKFFAILLFLSVSSNAWDRVPFSKWTKWNFDSVTGTVLMWFEQPPTIGSHTPNLQPGWVSTERLLRLFIETTLGHQGRTHYDYDALKYECEPNTKNGDFDLFKLSYLITIETGHSYNPIAFWNVGSYIT